MALTVVAVTSSMFWFPAPATSDPQVTAFLAMERQYITSPLTLGKAAMTTLVPIWFAALALLFWRRSWGRRLHRDLRRHSPQDHLELLFRR